MKYLLDTHTVIWALGDKVRLSESAKAIIDDVAAPLCVSLVSAWEIAIKVSLGKLRFVGGSAFFLSKMHRNGVSLFNIEEPYIKIVEALPFIHRDPFDRLLIATAISEDMTIITAYENIHKYDVPYIW